MKSRPKRTQEQRRRENRERDRTKPWRKLYATAAWKRARADQLSREPLCTRCSAKGITRLATVAHHKEQHHGDEWKFFNTPLESSCADCHDVIERGIEVRGYEAGATVEGRPTDPSHPWNTPPPISSKKFSWEK